MAVIINFNGFNGFNKKMNIHIYRRYIYVTKKQKNIFTI